MLPLIIIVLIISLSAVGQAKFSGFQPVKHSQGRHAASVDTHKA
ncbi:hypothetical protein [uncultured Limosilactobacillus sp.]|nr:hypothetical protein [uncultured Limosilactobacillus sp.]